MQTTIETDHEHRGNKDDKRYAGFLVALRDRFDARTEDGRAPLLTTDSPGLWEAYLTSFPEAERQYHNCNACRHFVERFGGLVIVDSKGRTIPAFFSEQDGPEYAAIVKIVKKARVTGVFLSSLPVFGEPLTGDWRHLSLKNLAVYKQGALTAAQAMAEKKEDFGQVARALGEFPQALVQKAMTILGAEVLYRAEKVQGPAKFLNDLHEARAALRGKARDNVLWVAIAKAPAGFCHPRSSMVGSLLEDLASGMDLETVKARFGKKMHPLQYLRPQAAPSVGSVLAAEKLFEKLGLASALRRRYARIEECETFWLPKKAGPAAGGIFSSVLGSAASKPLALGVSTMTWMKFARELLPSAEKIEYHAAHGNYCGLLTAVDQEAPSLFQWPHPVSWYVYHGGSMPGQWNLYAGAWTEVTGLSNSPAQWGDRKITIPHFSESVVAFLKGAKDYRSAGLCLFPEILKSELHGVRSVIEAYSAKGTPEGRDEGTANGIVFGSKGAINARLRVTSGASSREILIDRWD